MAGPSQAARVARRLHALGGGPVVVRKAAARVLAELDPVDATFLLSDLVRMGRGGDADAQCALAALVAALGMEADAIPHAASLRRIAALQELDAVVAMFASGAPKREMDRGAAAKADAQKFSDTLGHLKSKARITRNPDELSKLAQLSDATVMLNLLQNPRLTEELVVRIAARRPARPEPLVEIWKSPRWSSRHQIRRALAFNPYLPPEIGSKIVSLLNSTDLEELSCDGGVHPSLREQARLLLEKGRGR